jgi:dethiobiotin synthetase
MNYFVTAIGTDSGKTLVSAILCEALHADYWKPIQAGLPKDSETVKNLVANQTTIIHRERYLLNTPASPHAAAKIDGVQINIKDFKIPESKNSVIIEGAGGCLVPLNNEHFIIDLIAELKQPVVLVSNLYLGSINHTLLTVEALRSRQIEIHGLIFNGDSNPESERIIEHHTKSPVLLRIKKEKQVSRELISLYAEKIKKNLK